MRPVTRYMWRNCESIVYRVEFDDGSYYIGKTKRTLAERYSSPDTDTEYERKDHGVFFIVYEGPDIDTVERKLIPDEDVMCRNVIRYKAKPMPAQRRGRGVELISPSGETVSFPSVKAAARAVGVCPSNIRFLLHGKYKQCKGYTLNDKSPHPVD